MKLKTTVGQVFLTHPRDQNFTSLYEEAFSKHGQAVELFAVLEISGNNEALAKPKKTEYEKLFQIIVATLKKTYVSPVAINPETFEKALSSLNTALSRLMSKGKVNWYGNLNAAVGVLWENKLAVSTTGNALVYLVRKRDFSLLSEELVEETSKPTKIFSNYSSGRVLQGDRIILSTKQIFNYLSLDRIRAFLAEDILAETCQEIIKALADTKTVGFASFIFEINQGLGGSQSLETTGPVTSFVESRGSKASQIAVISHLVQVSLKGLLLFLWKLITALLGTIFRLSRNLVRNRPKKYLFIAIGAIFILLLVNIGITALNKTSQKKLEENKSALTSIEEKLDEAEAAFIYNDESRITALLLDAEKLLSNLNATEKIKEQYGALESRLQSLKSRITREVHLDNPIVLATFQSIPTDLYHSPNGFLMFNRNSFSLSFYDFRSGQTSSLLQNQNLSHLALGDFLGGTHGYIFLTTDGKAQKLDLGTGQLVKYEPETQILDPNLAKIQALAVLGEGDRARIYFLDTKQNQILRSRVSEQGPAVPEPWLKATAVNLSDAPDLAVDNSIYLLFPDRVDKYFNGQKQTFSLSPVLPPLKKAVKIFTNPESQFLYVLDPENSRVLVFTKAGKLDRQLTSPKFRDLADIFVDEKNKIMYLLSGPELLQINF